MIAAGAGRVITVDPFAISLTDAAHCKILLSDCQQLGLDPVDAFSRLQIIKDDIAAVLPPNDGVDLVVSNSVLEHVRHPISVLRSCLLWLKPGGVSFHIFDLRDHNFQSRYPFEMLAYSENFWTRWLDLSGGFHLNRWRLPDYRSAAHLVGFQNVACDVLSKDEVQLQAILDRIDRKFHRVSTEDLAILTAILYCEKPLGTSG
jgi:SAM-dependent methyltransferase